MGCAKSCVSVVSPVPQWPAAPSLPCPRAMARAGATRPPVQGGSEPAHCPPLAFTVGESFSLGS